MVKPTKTGKTVCPQCGKTGSIYYRLDGSMRCTACNYDSKKEEKK